MPDETDRSPRNPFELALWIVGIALIVVTVVTVWSLVNAISHVNYNDNCDANGDCATPAIQYIYQLVAVIAPGAVTGGFVCIAIALALRAFSFSRRHTSAPGPFGSSGESDPGEAVPVEVAPRVNSTEPVDPSVFMRPSRD